jgi:hypothetical protein
MNDGNIKFNLVITDDTYYIVIEYNRLLCISLNSINYTDKSIFILTLYETTFT